MTPREIKERNVRVYKKLLRIKARNDALRVESNKIHVQLRGLDLEIAKLFPDDPTGVSPSWIQIERLEKKKERIKARIAALRVENGKLKVRREEARLEIAKIQAEVVTVKNGLSPMQSGSYGAKVWKQRFLV